MDHIQNYKTLKTYAWVENNWINVYLFKYYTKILYLFEFTNSYIYGFLILI